MDSLAAAAGSPDARALPLNGGSPNGSRAGEASARPESASARFVPFHRIYSARSEAGLQRKYFGWCGEDLPLRDRPVLAGSVTKVSFRSIEDSLCEIRVLFGTYGRANSSRVMFELFEDGQAARSLLRSASHPASSFDEMRYFSFTFEPVQKARGRSFCLEISSPDGTPESCVGLVGQHVEVREESAASVLAPPLKGASAAERQMKTLFPLVSIPEEGATEIFLPFHYALSSMQGAARMCIGWAGAGLDQYYVPLGAERAASYCVRTNGWPLEQFKLYMVTFARRNTCRILLELFLEEQAGSRKIREAVLRGEEVRDNALNAFRIEPLELPEGSWLRVRVSSPDAGADNCIGLLGALLPAGAGRLRALGREGNLYSLLDTEQVLLEPANFISAGRCVKTRLQPGSQRGLSVLLVLAEAHLSGPGAALAAELQRELCALGYAVQRSFDLSGFEWALRLDELDLVVLLDPFWNDTLALALEILRNACVAVATVSSAACVEIELGREPQPAAEDLDPRSLAVLRGSIKGLVRAVCASDLVVSRSRELARYACLQGVEALARDAGAPWLGGELESFLAGYRARQLPSFSIVSVLYAKEREIESFLEAIYRQSYEGEIEIILVDDCSPDRSADRALAYAEGARAMWKGPRAFPQIRVIRNERNLGNCGSRNRGIAEARGEVVVVVDADCVMNRGFLEAHARAYAQERADAVIGFCNLETYLRDPIACLEMLERDFDSVAEEAVLQDASNRSSFLNCVTRNFSIRRDLAGEELFDDLFAYSADPASGYGWEDVEMGYRLYARGLKIRFAADSFSVHISHDSVSEERTKPGRSLLNFSRLLEKHPDLLRVARRWVMATFQSICQWSDSLGLAPTPERRRIEHMLKPYESLRIAAGPRRRPRVLTYRWHCAHQYELYKLPYDFTLVKFPWDIFVNSWSFAERPFPHNARMIPAESVDLRDYDLAILHFDENVLAPYNCNGIIGREWGSAFQWFRENVDLPCVAVCHGTPQFVGQYVRDYAGPDLGQVIEEERARLVEYVGAMPIVVNSHQAERDWQFANSRVIWHGFDPMEFQTTTYSRGILSLGKAMRDRPLYRGYDVYREVCERLPAGVIPEGLDFPAPHPANRPGTNSFGERMFDAYRDSIRRYSVYFNPTRRSPMPRSRGEAMMCGLASVSLANHDVELFIKSGWNGFYAHEAAELAEQLSFLSRRPEAAREMGRRGRELAMDIFNHDRYLAEWRALLSELGARL